VHRLLLSIDSSIITYSLTNICPRINLKKLTILLRPTERMTRYATRMRGRMREGSVVVGSFPHLTFLVQKLPFQTKSMEGWEGYEMSLGLLGDSKCCTYDLALSQQHHLFTSVYAGISIPRSHRPGSSLDPTASCPGSSLGFLILNSK